MTEHSLWRFSRALQRAINERQFEEIESVIDEDVDWAIYGPIDMFPFFGARRGRDAVIDVIRQIADNVRVRRSDRESVLLGVDSAASMLRFSRSSRPGASSASGLWSIRSTSWSRLSANLFIYRK